MPARQDGLFTEINEEITLADGDRYGFPCLAAMPRMEGLTIVTADRKFEPYQVSITWT